MRDLCFTLTRPRKKKKKKFKHPSQDSRAAESKKPNFPFFLKRRQSKKRGGENSPFYPLAQEKRGLFSLRRRLPPSNTHLPSALDRTSLPHAALLLLLATAATASAADENRAFELCSDTKIQRGDGFSFGLADPPPARVPSSHTAASDPPRAHLQPPADGSPLFPLQLDPSSHTAAVDPSPPLFLSASRIRHPHGFPPSHADPPPLAVSLGQLASSTDLTSLYFPLLSPDLL